MKFRDLISVTALFAMAHILLTSTILYVMPAGRVAYWSNWQYLGLEKTAWGRQHVVLYHGGYPDL